MKTILHLILLTLSFEIFGINSLSDLDSSWLDQNNDSITLSKDLKSEYNVITMIFTSCPSACPLMVKHLKELDEKLEKNKNVTYFLFSIDPKDNQEKILEFYQKMKLDHRFKILRSKSVGDIQEVAALLGFKYKKLDENMYSHSMNVYVLNQRGEIIDSVGQSYKAHELVRSIKIK